MLRYMLIYPFCAVVAVVVGLALVEGTAMVVANVVGGAFLALFLACLFRG